MYRKTNIAHALSLLGLLSVAGQGLAQEEGLFFDAVPIVYSASRMPQHQSETPNFVTVIDRDMIRASGAREVSDLLRFVPGFQVTSRGVEVPARVAYHGLVNDDYSPRLQILIDGKSQYSALFKGGVNWDLLPVAIEDIERIEVVRGANVAAYGTNAFMGVVNIVTTDPSLQKGTTLGASLGTRGLVDQYVGHGGQVGDVEFRLTFKGQEDQGNQFSRLPKNATSNNPLENDPLSIANAWRNRLFAANAQMPINQRDELVVRFSAMDGRYETGRSSSYQFGGKLYNPPRIVGMSTYQGQLDWRRNYEDGDELLIRFSSVEDRLDDPPVPGSSASLSDLSPFPINGTGSSVRHSLELQRLSNFGQTLRVVWGVAGQSERVDQPINFYGGQVSRTTNRAFSSAEWRYDDKWLLNLGGSWDSDSVAGPTFSPRVSVNYLLERGHTLRAGIVNAYRVPSLYEYRGWSHFGQPNVGPITDDLQTQYKANGDIKPEHLTGYEFGYFGDFPVMAATVDARLFSELVSNRLQVVNKRPVNLERVHLEGAEYQIQWKPQPETRVFFGQSLVSIKSTLSDANEVGFQSQTEASAPNLSNSLMVMQSFPNDFHASVMVYHVDAVRWAKDYDLRTPAYTRVDWRLAKRFTVGTTRAEVAYVVQSEEGAHAELKPSNLTVPKQWVSLRIEL